MQRRLRIAAGVAAAAALVLVLARAWPGRALPLEIVAVEETTLRQTVVAAGRVSSAVQVQVGALITGRVERTPVAAGAAVRRGELLLQLEPAAEHAALGQADAAVEQARLQVDEAERQLRRYRELAAARAISAAQLDSEGNRLELARSQLQNSRAARDSARARLAETSIRAPADGILLRRDVEIGDLVQPGKPVLVLAVRGPVQVRVNVDERHLASLHLGQPATIVADAYPDRPFGAVVGEIAPLVDRQNGTVEVRLAVPEPPAFVLNDMTASAEIVVAQAEHALVVPAAALQQGEDGAWVWRVAEGQARRQPVTVGLRGSSRVQIADGLRAGERLVGQAVALREGQAVEPKAGPAR